MKFKAGYLGVCIVVISLLATVAIGYNLNVNETTEYQDAYKNITNITGQFSYSEGSAYVDYNPAQNYTGYTSGSLDFTQSSTANQYTFIKTPGSHSTTTVDLADTGYYSTYTHEVGTNTYTGDRDNWWLINGYAINVADILNHQSIDYTSITGGIDINLLYGSTYQFGNFGATPNLVTTKTNNTFNNEFGYGVGYRYTDSTGTTVYKGGVSEAWYWASALRPCYMIGHQIFSYYIHVDQNGTATVYLNGSATDIGTVNSIYVAWSDKACYTNTGGGTPATSTGPWNGGTGNSANLQVDYMAQNSIPATNIITIDYDIGAVVDYMRISDGVSFLDPTVYHGTDTPYYPEWTNGSLNASISWVVHFDDLSNNSIMIARPVYTDTNIPNNIRTSVYVYAYNGTVQVWYAEWLNGAVYYEVSKDVGSWNNVLVTLDCQSRTVTCTPITSLTNYQTFTLSDSTITIQDGFPILAGYDDLLFDSIRYDVLSDTLNGYRFSVADTTIYMGINKSLFINPSINPRAYFPATDYPILRVTFDSMALIGSSITINNVAYPVINNKIVINNEEISVSGLSVTYYDDGHIYAGNGDRTVDLGTSIDDTISLAGQWYYQARAQSGYLEEVETVAWDAGTWAIDFQQAVLIYEGLLIAGIIISKYKLNLATLDWAVLIVAMFGGAVLFV